MPSVSSVHPSPASMVLETARSGWFLCVVRFVVPEAQSLWTEPILAVVNAGAGDKATSKARVRRAGYRMQVQPVRGSRPVVTQFCVPRAWVDTSENSPKCEGRGDFGGKALYSRSDLLCPHYQDFMFLSRL